MTLPRKPFGRIDPVDYFSSGIETYHFSCSSCGIKWELTRLSSDDPQDIADDGYYLSFYTEDTMTWLGPLHENTATIQARARKRMNNHLCFKTSNQSDSSGCFSLILITLLVILSIIFLT